MRVSRPADRCRLLTLELKHDQGAQDAAVPWCHLQLQRQALASIQPPALQRQVRQQAHLRQRPQLHEAVDVHSRAQQEGFSAAVQQMQVI